MTQAPAVKGRAKPQVSGDSHTVYQRLRRDILSGALAPGEVLNTVHIAQAYQVSRTPVREALRMLQAEGLVDAPFHHRMRVTAVSPSEVDAVYATWILVQSLAVGLTLTKMSSQDLKELRAALEAMNKITPMNSRSRAAWEKLHLHYNKLLIRQAGPEVLATIENCWLRSERARRTNTREGPGSWVASEADHTAVVRAFEKGSVADAVRLTSMHLARVALEVIRRMDANFVPTAIHHALALTAAPGAAALPQTATAAAPAGRQGSGQR